MFLLPFGFGTGLDDMTERVQRCLELMCERDLDFDRQVLDHDAILCVLFAFGHLIPFYANTVLLRFETIL